MIEPMSVTVVAEAGDGDTTAELVSTAPMTALVAADRASGVATVLPNRTTGLSVAAAAELTVGDTDTEP